MNGARFIFHLADRTAGRLAHWGTTMGQISLAALGTHLAADRLDDHILNMLGSVRNALDQPPLRGPMSLLESADWLPALRTEWMDGGQGPFPAGIALLAELTTIWVLASAILFTPRTGRPSWTAWSRARCVQAVTLPLTLGGALLAGGWSLAMTAEDLLPPSPLARPASLLLALAVEVRFAWPAWCRAMAALVAGPPWSVGLKRALVLGPMAVLIWLEALPTSGLVSWLVRAA